MSEHEQAPVSIIDDVISDEFLTGKHEAYRWRAFLASALHILVSSLRDVKITSNGEVGVLMLSDAHEHYTGSVVIERIADPDDPAGWQSVISLAGMDHEGSEDGQYRRIKVGFFKEDETDPKKYAETIKSIASSAVHYFLLCKTAHQMSSLQEAMSAVSISDVPINTRSEYLDFIYSFFVMYHEDRDKETTHSDDEKSHRSQEFSV